MNYMNYSYLMEITEIISANFKRLRAERQLTQRFIAEACGVSLQQIGDIEAGRRKPSIDLLFAMASCLKVESGEFLDSHTDKPPAPIILPSKALQMYSRFPDEVIIRAQAHKAESEVWEWIIKTFDEYEDHHATGEKTKKNHS